MSFHLLCVFSSGSVTNVYLTIKRPLFNTLHLNRKQNDLEHWPVSRVLKILIHHVLHKGFSERTNSMGRASSAVGVFALQGWQQYNWWVNGRRWKGQSKTVRDPFNVCTNILHKSRCMSQTFFLHWLLMSFFIWLLGPKCSYLSSTHT